METNRNMADPSIWSLSIVVYPDSGNKRWGIKYHKDPGIAIRQHWSQPHMMRSVIRDTLYTVLMVLLCGVVTTID